MRQADPPPPTSLEGKFLIAMPSLREGPFARSVVYMCAHRDDGAMGIVINHRAAEIDFGQLLTQLDIVPEAEAIRLPPRAQAVRVLRGGPRTRSSPTAGSPAPLTPDLSSTPISTANTIVPWRSSASTKGCCPPTRATPRAFAGFCSLTPAAPLSPPKRRTAPPGP